MRFMKAAGAVWLSYLAASVVRAAEVVKEEPAAPESTPEVAELVASAEWPDSNPFGHVVNGEKNTLTVLIENKTGKNVTLTGVSGSIHHPETEKIIKNLTTLAYNVGLLQNVKLSVPYTFYSEFKPGDVKLNIWIDHVTDDVKERVNVFEQIVTVVEPEGSWFDFKLISTYLTVIALLGGLGYLSYVSFVPQPKKAKRVPVSAPVAVTATGAGGYQDEWIPDHHKPKLGKRRGTGAVSGDELSGAETSGTESSKKEKTRKRK